MADTQRQETVTFMAITYVEFEEPFKRYLYSFRIKPWTLSVKTYMCSLGTKSFMIADIPGR